MSYREVIRHPLAAKTQQPSEASAVRHNSRFTNTWDMPNSPHHFRMGNGQKQELPVFSGQKRMYPENNSGRECLKKNQNAPRPSEHAPVRGEKCRNVYVGS